MDTKIDHMLSCKVCTELTTPGMQECTVATNAAGTLLLKIEGGAPAAGP